MTGAAPHGPTEVDPFDLPDWLGTGEVTWSSTSGLGDSARLSGVLAGDGHRIDCDLLAADEAYPTPATDDATRRRTHQAWRHGQVHLAAYDGRLTVLVPGSRFTADLVLDVLGRLARAVGADPDRYAARLTVGQARPGD